MLRILIAAGVTHVLDHILHDWGNSISPSVRVSTASRFSRLNTHQVGYQQYPAQALNIRRVIAAVFPDRGDNVLLVETANCLLSFSSVGG
jgi:hypothetical protein